MICCNVEMLLYIRVNGRVTISRIESSDWYSPHPTIAKKCEPKGVHMWMLCVWDPEAKQPQCRATH
jgi:hypothetical protein